MRTIRDELLFDVQGPLNKVAGTTLVLSAISTHTEKIVNNARKIFKRKGRTQR